MRRSASAPLHLAAVLPALIAVASGCGTSSYGEEPSPDGGALDGRSDGAVDGSSEAAADAGVDAGGDWAWEGETNEQWTISNADGAVSTDCCGCAGACAPCVDNTSLGQAGPGLTFFTSGPSFSNGQNHRIDGFVAIRRGVPVIPGQAQTVHIGVTKLSAQATGGFGVEANQVPSWRLTVREGTRVMGSYEATFDSNKCMNCSGDPKELGDRVVPFTPEGSTVDVVLVASYLSTQCAAETFGVRVEVDYVRVQPQ